MKLSRRTFCTTGLGAVTGMCAVDAFLLEPSWLKITSLNLEKEGTGHTLIHFTDLHHKGDTAYLETVVNTINSISADLVCFTGDIVEDAAFSNEALEAMARINKPLFGVPGNHDYWTQLDMTLIAACFESTGGAWFNGEGYRSVSGIGLYGTDKARVVPVTSDSHSRDVLLTHYPETADIPDQHQFDLVLAGHTHGGQVALPFYGALVTPYHSGSYESGLYDTPAGPLYVNPGIGTFGIAARFCCRPELTVIRL
jgi:uncharacterized protein